MKFTEKAVLTAQSQVALQNTAGRSCVVYLLHFTAPIAQTKSKSAGHYIGLTNNVTRRLGTHAAGRSSGLVKTAMSRGKVVVVRLWQQDGHFEQKLKRRKNARRLCPICRQQDGLKSVPRIFKTQNQGEI